MRSRFEQGLITDVQIPDLETRIAILRKQAQSEQLQVPDDILEFMASKVSSNIRELEGTLIRVTAFASLNRTPVDMAARADGAEGPDHPRRGQRDRAGRHHRQRSPTTSSSPSTTCTARAGRRQIADRPADRDVPLPRADQPVAAEDRSAVRRPRPHHGDVREQEDQRAHEGAALDLQPGHRSSPAASSRTSATAGSRRRSAGGRAVARRPSARSGQDGPSSDVGSGRGMRRIVGGCS